MKLYSFVADKLVRDNAIQLFDQLGIQTTYGQLQSDRIIHYLKKKLDEEANEAFRAETEEEMISELCDVYEVMVSLLSDYGLNWESFQEKVKAKKIIKGGFQKAVYLKTLTLAEGHPKLPHYLKESQRYTLIPL
jgi:predicted house-cleaning noncanonical NTP pyrophosphatase (MazG superfamily)